MRWLCTVTLRQLGAYADIPVVIWTPLLLGYAALTVCSLFLNVGSIRRHLLMNGLLGVLIGLVVYIILLFDTRFLEV